jgi:hypothetical protein
LIRERPQAREGFVSGNPGALNPIVDQLAKLLMAALLLIASQPFQVQICLLVKQVVQLSILLVFDKYRLLRRLLEGLPLLIAKFDTHSQILPQRSAKFQSAAVFERQQRFADRSHVVDAKDLHALPREAQGDADSRLRAVCRRVADQLAQKAFARMAHKHRAAECV